MAEGKILKPDQDFSSVLDTELPSISPLPLPQALERLTALEKQTRQASDAISTKRILILVVQLCAQSNEWDLLNDNILAFSKKHGQLKAAAQGMVAEAWGILKKKDWVEERKVEQRGNLIETLRVVTEGKVFVEVEQARVTRLLAGILEHSTPSKVAEAATTLCELQVETYGSMYRLKGMVDVDC
jgi:26S proteasome regulatory subunit N5